MVLNPGSFSQASSSGDFESILSLSQMFPARISCGKIEGESILSEVLDVI